MAVDNLMEDEPFPRVTKALLHELEERFPPRYPALDWEDRRIWYQSGQRAVVDFLKERHKAQTQRGVLN